MTSRNTLQHLEELVSFYPATNDQTAVLRLLHYCAKQLKQTDSFKDARIHLNEGIYSFTASTQGTKQPKLLLQAHIDVVPGPTSLKYGTKGDTITGRGVYDMLFATGSYLSFIEEHNGKLDGLDIGLMLTGDEEMGGYDGVKHLMDNGYGCHVCILPDAGHGFGDLNVSAKGVYNFELVVHGEAHHGSRPWEGDGAARKLMKLLNELSATFDDSDHHNSTLTIARLQAGDADNKGPSQASARLDIRYKDGDYKVIEKRMQALCVKYNASIENTISADSYGLDTTNEYVEDFLKLYEKHAKQPITLGKAHGSSDARFFAAKGIPVIMFRPDGSGAHSDHEMLSLSSLHKFDRLLEEFVLKTAKIK